MPNTYLDNAQRWLDLSEVDYLGQFVKAWLAFNAWYRAVYSQSQDRQIIIDFKWGNNVARSKLVPLLTSSAEEGVELRSNIGLLHNRLENFHLHSGKHTETIRISFKAIYLKASPLMTDRASRYGIVYEVTRGGAGVPAKQVKSVVVNSTGSNVFTLTQQKYDIAELESTPTFINSLAANQQGALRAVYRKVDPNVVVDLTNSGKPPIQCGAHTFSSTAEDLFAGMCEVIYLMRCILFHGELVPSHGASGCYEPAYHIVRRFLLSIS